MKQLHKVLIIDDHPVLCERYDELCNEVMKRNPQIKIKTELAGNCDTAKEKINNTWSKGGLDLVILDIRLPPSKDRRILSGEDLGELIRKKHPLAKIIVATTFNDNYRIQNIFKSFDPEGFLIKNDMSSVEIMEALQKVLQGGKYYTSAVDDLMRKQALTEIRIDKLDRQILYELSQGTKMKDLPKFVPLSMAGIEKRKRAMKRLFDVEDQGDKALISKAKELGFI